MFSVLLFQAHLDTIEVKTFNFKNHIQYRLFKIAGQFELPDLTVPNSGNHRHMNGRSHNKVDMKHTATQTENKVG
jgi:hypothetical protein